MGLNYKCAYDIMLYVDAHIRPTKLIELYDMIHHIYHSYNDVIFAVQYLRDIGCIDAYIDLGCFVDTADSDSAAVSWDSVIIRRILPDGYELLRLISDDSLFGQLNRMADKINRSEIFKLALSIRQLL